MGFWIFMLIMNLLIPFTMIGFGEIFCKRPPKKINNFYGYRTTMSRKSKETWNFAHQYFGRIWRIGGWILLPITVVAMLFVLGKGDDTVGFYGGILEMIQCIYLIIPIIPTEFALRKHFDNNGVWKI